MNKPETFEEGVRDCGVEVSTKMTVKKIGWRERWENGVFWKVIKKHLTIETQQFIEAELETVFNEGYEEGSDNGAHIAIQWK